MVWEQDYKTVLRRICQESGSKVSKRSHTYFPALNHFSKDKVLCEILGDYGFYFASLSKTGVRLIEIALDKAHQRKGLGRKLLYRLLSQAKARGLYKLTFRTPMDEEAQFFWLKMGASIVDVKGNDYVMELNFK